MLPCVFQFLQLRSKPYQYGTVITEVPPRFLAPNQLSSRAARGGGTFCQTAGLTPEPLWIIPLCLVLVLLHGETWPFLGSGRVAVLRSLSCGGRRCFVRLLTFSWSQHLPYCLAAPVFRVAPADAMAPPDGGDLLCSLTPCQVATET